MDILAIKEIIDTTIEKAIYFEDFAQKAMGFGVKQICLDLVKREHVFYGEDDAYFAYQLPDDYEFAIAEDFNAEQIKEAIAGLDTQKLSPQEFMVRVSQAGVMMAIAFLADKRCIYLGRQGQFFAEEW